MGGDHEGAGLVSLPLAVIVITVIAILVQQRTPQQRRQGLRTLAQPGRPHSMDLGRISKIFGDLVALRGFVRKVQRMYMAEHSQGTYQDEPARKNRNQNSDPCTDYRPTPKVKFECWDPRSLRGIVSQHDESLQNTKISRDVGKDQGLQSAEQLYFIAQLVINLYGLGGNKQKNK